MRRQGGGFGFVVMLVVLAVVFYLAMNNFKSTAPSAVQIQRHNEARKVGQDPPAEPVPADAWTESPPARPSLSTVDKNTTEHAADVKDALSQTN